MTTHTTQTPAIEIKRLQKSYGKFSWLLKVGPFYYAPALDPLIYHRLTWWHPLVLIGAGLVCGIAGLLVFNRRDFPTV